MLGLAVPVFGQYAGPAILARGEAPAAMQETPISFRPFITLSATYDTGLAGVAVTDQGQLATSAAYGAMISGGISGMKKWKRTTLGLDYRGSYTDYRTSQGQGYDQSFMLGLNYRLNRHTTFNFRETAGGFTRNFGMAGLAETVPFDPVGSYVPTTDFFDNRTLYLTSQADVVFQKSARLSFDLGGGLFINRRLSTALHGAVGESAMADMQYRISRRQTVGAVYTFNHMGYNNVLGGSFIHGVSGAYSIRLSRWWEFSGSGGFMRAESKFLQTTAVDPIIAELLGISYTTQLYHNILYRPSFSGRISRTIHHGVLYAFAGNAMTPGNGLFLTSYATILSGGYSYTGLRHWSASVTAGQTFAQAYGNIAGSYGGLTSQLSVSHTLTRNMSLSMNYSARKYQSPDYQNYNRLIYSASFGFSWSPGEVPLRIW